MTIGIGLLCKPPRPGISKTRLARGIGPVAASSLTDAFLRDVAATATRFSEDHDVSLFAFCRPAEAVDEMRAYFPPNMPVLPQDGDDLGAVMRASIARMLVDCRDGALVVGCDVPHLPVAVLAEAATHLRASKSAAVIGPSEDGGYYLIGMTDLSFAALLDPLPWSTPDVYRLTVERARNQGLALHALARQFDVDEPADLERLRHWLADAPPDIAPATRRVLRNIGSGVEAAD
jgi:rSAM/selenodomain-associated transferase 1